MRDRHVVVTGAGSGIGLAVTLRLAEAGANLTLLARRPSRLEAAAEQAQAVGAGSCFVGAVDIRQRERVAEVFDEASSVNGPVHALIANAGVGGPNGPGDGDRFDDLVATNLGGTYHCVRAAQRHLAAGPEERHMVLMSSILARIGVPGYTGYCASKAALLGLARALAMEFAGDNVQVNALCPGWVDTEMAAEGLALIARDAGCSPEEAYRLAMQQVPLGRMSAPEDIAGLVVWLLSPAARGVTGQGLDMNNGAFMI